MGAARKRALAEANPSVSGWSDVTQSIQATFAHCDHANTWRLRAKARAAACLLSPHDVVG